MLSDSFIPKTAFDLFREWVKNAKNKYPYYNFDIINERCLVDDLSQSFDKAVKSIYSDKNFESRDVPGWSTGFFLGFVSSNLNYGWHHEYIGKQTNAYRHVHILNAIRKSYTGDPVVHDKLHKAYEEILASDCNLVVGTKSGGKDFFVRYLDELIDASNQSYVNFDDESFLPELSDHITSEQVVEIIEFYEEKNSYDK